MKCWSCSPSCSVFRKYILLVTQYTAVLRVPTNICSAVHKKKYYALLVIFLNRHVFMISASHARKACFFILFYFLPFAAFLQSFTCWSTENTDGLLLVPNDTVIAFWISRLREHFGNGSGGWRNVDCGAGQWFSETFSSVIVILSSALVNS